MSAQEKKVIIISGSSRKWGNTSRLMQHLSNRLGIDWYNLANYNISYYDYEHKNASDDFLMLAKKMVDANVIILATPVYWYTMSAQMKVFIDRWSDLLTIRKDLGRALKGKALLLLSCGSDEARVEGFELPFSQTAAYMEMEFVGHLYSWLHDQEDIERASVQKRVDSLVKSIRKNLHR